MSLADDLLTHAEKLLGLESRKPKQVTLRRAVSAAYYGLFHLLTGEAAALYAADPAMAARVGRTFNHNAMKKASQGFANSKLPKSLQDSGPSGVNFVVTPDLKFVAESFIALQLQRHCADYDLTKHFQKLKVKALTTQARQAFDAWDRVKATDDARLYLACFLLWETWDKEPRA